MDRFNDTTLGATRRGCAVFLEELEEVRMLPNPSMCAVVTLCKLLFTMFCGRILYFSDRSLRLCLRELMEFDEVSTSCWRSSYSTTAWLTRCPSIVKQGHKFNKYPLVRRETGAVLSRPPGEFRPAMWPILDRVYIQ